MPASFPIIEISVFMLFAITLVTSLQISLNQAAALLVASLFGMAIEFFFVHTTG